MTSIVLSTTPHLSPAIPIEQHGRYIVRNHGTFDLSWVTIQPFATCIEVDGVLWEREQYLAQYTPIECQPFEVFDAFTLESPAHE